MKTTKKKRGGGRGKVVKSGAGIIIPINSKGGLVRKTGEEKSRLGDLQNETELGKTHPERRASLSDN